MRIWRCRRGWILVILGVLLIAPFVVCAIGFSHDAKQEAMDEAAQLLSFVKRYPTDVLPQNNIPSNLWVDEKCWTRLQNAMSKNSYQYSIEIAYDSNDIPSYPSNSHEVGINVKFADGNSVLVQFFQGGLIGCH